MPSFLLLWVGPNPWEEAVEAQHAGGAFQVFGHHVAERSLNKLMGGRHEAHDSHRLGEEARRETVVK